VCAAHAKIFAAIEAGDAELARKRVERDVRAYGVILEAAMAAAMADEQATE
jgi:DNA-binding GntR family transcriptional regulator